MRRAVMLFFAHIYTHNKRKTCKHSLLGKKAKEKCKKKGSKKWGGKKLCVRLISTCGQNKTDTYRNCVFFKYPSVPRNDRCFYNQRAERYPGNSSLPFSRDFGDLETEVHGVQIGRLPLEDIVTSPGLVRLRRDKNEERFW